MRRFLTIRSNGQALTGLPLNSNVDEVYAKKADCLWLVI